jgi:nucleoside-diphosphate-sugar epimerase
MQCLLLILQNPPGEGEYRVVNQFDAVHSVSEMAQAVMNAAERLGLQTQPVTIENPRVEEQQHYYNPHRERLTALGYSPSGDIAHELQLMIEDLLPHRARLERLAHVLEPKIRWRKPAGA